MPTNRFVAGFIGSPSMNFVQARVAAGGAVFAGNNFRLQLSPGLAEAVARRGLEDVWVGVRPEHLKLYRDTDLTASNLIRSVVEVVEPQGSTTIMQLSVGNEIRLIAQFNEQLDREPATPLILSVAPRIDLSLRSRDKRKRSLSETRQSRCSIVTYCALRAKPFELEGGKLLCDQRAATNEVDETSPLLNKVANEDHTAKYRSELPALPLDVGGPGS
jgi:ABC-type sugar transport system ATPase subunit